MLSLISDYKRRIASKFYLMNLLLILTPLCHAQAILTKSGSSFPMFNSSDLSAWLKSGNANWHVNGLEVVANQGKGMLISKFGVPDLQLDFDYWMGENTQATIFIRCINTSAIAPDTAYEVRLSNSLQLSGGAGSIINLLKMNPSMVANQWNHIQVSAIGAQISVTLNGVTGTVVDSRFAAGPIALNYQGGDLRLKNFNFTIPGRW